MTPHEHAARAAQLLARLSIEPEDPVDEEVLVGVSIAHALLALAAPSEPDDVDRLIGAAEPCGSWRTTVLHEGYPLEQVWCDRRSGPCPWPGTPAAPGPLDAISPTPRWCAALLEARSAMEQIVPAEVDR